jgi:hypothetical protein
VDDAVVAAKVNTAVTAKFPNLELEDGKIVHFKDSIHISGTDHVALIQSYGVTAGNNNAVALSVTSNTGDTVGVASRAIVANAVGKDAVAATFTAAGDKALGLIVKGGAQVDTLHATEILRFTGGQDVAENFLTSEPAEAGDVVIIDVGEKETLKLCSIAYDSRVAGIISTDPGILASKEEQGQPLALAGRVPTKVDASYGEVKTGDLLTTSATPGHAMVVKDKTQAIGAIIGKALESLKEGQAKIMVLVTLQ